MRDYLNKLKDVPCLDCKGKFPPIVMDFDHVEGSIKFSDVGILAHYGSWDRLKTEVSKCEVVCANCHRIRTKERIDRQCTKEASDTPNVAGGVRFSG